MKRNLAFSLWIGAAVLLFAASLAAQEFSLQGSNEARWADGRERLGNIESPKRYFENRLNMDLYFDRLRFGTRFTVLQPSEFGQTLPRDATLEKRFLEYRSPDESVRLRAGDFYTVWGRGLTLALMEDINQGFDSGLDGVLASGDFGPLHAEALSGRSRAGFLGLVREAQVNGVHLAAGLPFGLRAGAQVMQVLPAAESGSYDESSTWGGFLSYDGSSVSLWAETALEAITGRDDTFDATYLSASWYGGAVGIALDYKNYNYFRYGSGPIGAGSIYSQSVDILPFHSAPIVQREATSPLFGKHPHIVRYEDEVGVQLEVTWSPGDIGSLVLSAAQSSGHENEGALLPSLKEENSPYRELFLELDSYPRAGWYLSTWAGANEDLVYFHEGQVRARTLWDRRAALGMRNEVTLSGNLIFVGEVEGLRTEDKVLEENYLDGLLVLGAVWKTDYSLLLTLEATGQENPPEGRDSWLKGDFRAFIDNRHELLLTVGQERGGLVCTSGKCRVVTPFNGVKVTFTSLF